MQKRYGYVLDTKGNPVAGATVAVTVFGTVTAATLYSDSGGVTAISNPVATDAEGFYEYYAANGRYTENVTTNAGTESISDILLQDALSQIDQFAAATGTGDAMVIAAFSSGYTLEDGDEIRVRAPGSNSITNPTISLPGVGVLTIYKLGGSGLQPNDINGSGHEITLRYRASPSRMEFIGADNKHPVFADSFSGVDKTGLSNSTTGLKAFFDHCIATGKAGHIPTGTYLVTAGVLVFDNAFVDTAWPFITTDGYDNVTFKRADATDAPLITISNGTATSGSGNYWNGGSLGGITFDQNGKATGSSQHGLSIRGIWGCKFGWMRANDQGGSCVYLPEALYSSTNPDPYAVTFCEFEGIEANRCLRYALENRNWAGFNGCRVKFLRVIECVSGGWYGFGTGNFVDIISMGSVGGWALDDGTQTAATGGASLRIYVGIAELDDVENGLRLNRCQLSTFDGIRFNHRYNFSSLNPSGGYWPRIAFDIGGGTSANITQIVIKCTHRIEAGGAKVDMGVFVDLNSVGHGSVDIDQNIIDNAGFGFDDADLYTGFSTSSRTRLTRASELLAQSRRGIASTMRGSSAGTALTIGNNPITTTNGSPIINVTATAHGMVVGQCFTLQGATLTNNVPAAEINRSHPVTSVVDADNVTVTCETNANASGAGGGAGVTGAKDRSFLNIVGAGTIKTKLAIPTEVSDQEGHYDPAQYEFTVPYTGLYRVNARIAWTGLAAGNRVRLYVYANISTSPATALHGEHRCQGVNVETFAISEILSLTAGQKLCVGADCNAAAAIAMSFVAVNDVSFSVEAL